MNNPDLKGIKPVSVTIDGEEIKLTGEPVFEFGDDYISANDSDTGGILDFLKPQTISFECKLTQKPLTP